MRPLVEPPPSTKCSCGGELRLKKVQLARSAWDREVDEVFVCARCNCECTMIVGLDKYSVPPTTRL